MKAVCWTKYGSPNHLQIKEIDKPIAKNNELLIKVHATTVNRTDCAMLRATPFIARFYTGLFKPNKPILGTEFSGQVEAIGENVSKFKVGDSVFGFDGMGCDSHAQYITIAEDNSVGLMPANLTYNQAAPSLEGAHYALNFINKVGVNPQHEILVNGATGGIGSAAVQLCKFYGAKVTAVCEGANTELVKSIGADEIIDFTKTDFTKSDKKYNYIFDTVGKSSFAKCKPLLKPKGVYISSELGRGSQNIFLALFTPLFGKKKVVFPLPVDIDATISLIQQLISESKFKAVIDREYTLDTISEAFNYVEKGQKIGNVVITVNS